MKYHLPRWYSSIVGDYQLIKVLTYYLLSYLLFLLLNFEKKEIAANQSYSSKLLNFERTFEVIDMFLRTFQVIAIPRRKPLYQISQNS